MLMKSVSDSKKRILNFLLGNERIPEFESWVYTHATLKNSIGQELYCELVEINYSDKDVIYNLRKRILGKHIPLQELYDFQYDKMLHDSGWYQSRSIELDRTKYPNSPEVVNAINIIKAFGGLKIIAPNGEENELKVLVEFFETPDRIQNMSEYGLDKFLVCFATAQNGYLELFVDENNIFYQLDNVMSEYLYEYKGAGFKLMMQQLLEIDDNENFTTIGKRKLK